MNYRRENALQAVSEILGKSCAMNNFPTLPMVTRVRYFELSHHCVVITRFCTGGGTIELLETRSVFGFYRFSVLGRTRSVLSPDYFIFWTHSHPVDAVRLNKKPHRKVPAKMIRADGRVYMGNKEICRSVLEDRKKL